MRRRSYLAALSGVGIGSLAGCVSGNEQSTATGTTQPPPATRTATATDTPAYRHCETPVTPTTPSAGGDYRRSYPDFPDELNVATALSFVRAFERARRQNEFARQYRDRVTYVQFKHARIGVESVVDGYVVEYEDEFAAGHSSDEVDGTVHGDEPFTVTYFVAPTIVRRSEGETDPRDLAESEVVVCRPGA